MSKRLIFVVIATCSLMVGSVKATTTPKCEPVAGWLLKMPLHVSKTAIKDFYYAYPTQEACLQALNLAKSPAENNCSAQMPCSCKSGTIYQTTTGTETSYYSSLKRCEDPTGGGPHHHIE